MMQRVLVLSLFAIICLPAIVFGQWSDNFDSYDTLSTLVPQGGWEGWGGGADPATIDDQSLSAPNGLAVSGGSDLVQTFTGATSGQWTFATSQYIPSTSAGTHYFIMLNNYGASNAWSVQLPFNMDTGLMNDDQADGVEDVPIVTDAWVDLRLEIDLDANTVDSYYDGTQFSTHQWYNENEMPPHQPVIAALDIYPAAADTGVVWYDDMSLSAVPEPATGLLLLVGGLAALLRRRRG